MDVQTLFECLSNTQRTTNLSCQCQKKGKRTGGTSGWNLGKVPQKHPPFVWGTATVKNKENIHFRNTYQMCPTTQIAKMAWSANDMPESSHTRLIPGGNIGPNLVQVLLRRVHSEPKLSQACTPKIVPNLTTTHSLFFRWCCLTPIFTWQQEVAQFSAIQTSLPNSWSQWHDSLRTSHSVGQAPGHARRTAVQN